MADVDRLKAYFNSITTGIGNPIPTGDRQIELRRIDNLLRKYAASQLQHNGPGDLRERLYAPNANGPADNFEHAIDIEHTGEDGISRWAWVDRLGPEVVLPPTVDLNMDGIADNGQQPPEPPSDSIISAIAALTAQQQTMVEVIQAQNTVITNLTNAVNQAIANPPAIQFPDYVGNLFGFTVVLKPRV